MSPSVAFFGLFDAWEIGMVHEGGDFIRDLTYIHRYSTAVIKSGMSMALVPKRFS